MTDRYCLDTNALIRPWNGYYAPAICPTYWELLAQLAKKGIVFCPDEVRRELEKKDDGLFAWARKTPDMFAPATEIVQEHLGQILARFPRLLDTRKGRNAADPWVIAIAMAQKATVVTQEKMRNRGTDRYGIPDVCAGFNINCIDDHRFVHDIGFRFTATLDPPLNGRPDLGFQLS